MANNLRVFNTNSEYQSADLILPAVSYVVETDKVIYDAESPTPPVFQGKWKATYQDSHVESAQCGSSSEIVENEINKTNLVSVEIGDCVTSIGNQAFYGCTSLTSVTIGSGILVIYDYAFKHCRSLTSITVEAETPPSFAFFAISVFDGSTCPIYVPSQSVNAYKAASGWRTYASRIQPIP